MNAETTIQEIELATWAMAEAESLEKRAHKLRVDATRTLAKVRLEMIDALEEAKQKRNAQGMAAAQAAPENDPTASSLSPCPTC